MCIKKKGNSKSFIKYQARIVNQVYVDDNVNTASFFKSLQEKYIAKCFEYIKFPLDSFLHQI